MPSNLIYLEVTNSIHTYTYNGFTPYTTLVTCDYPVPVKDEPIDQRFNPKFWAKWFREFLEELLKPGFTIVKREITRETLVSCFFIRSGPPRVREWKMKLWKQAHAIAA